MGRHARYLLVSACLSAANPAVGAANRDIELTDGSHLVGEIVAVDQGTYTVKSERLGVVRLKDADIVAIRAPGAAPPTVKAGPFRYLALSVEKDAAPGQVDAKYYDAAASRWTGTVAIQRYE